LVLFLQEAFVDPNRDESIIVELLELKDTVVDEKSSRWFLQDLAIEQESEQSLVVESENTITTAVDVPNLEASIPVNVTVGTLVSFSHLQESCFLPCPCLSLCNTQDFFGNSSKTIICVVCCVYVLGQFRREL
jgi:hypothetical protein